MTEEKIRPLVETALEERGAFLVELHVSSGGNIMVYADKDDGIDLGDLKMISRHIEGALDREVEDFSLEVSSPGAFSPFKLHRQYLKNKGRSVEVRLEDGTKHKGMMVEVTETGITLETQKRVPKETGKGKKTITVREDLTFDQIAETKLEFKF
ncbi:ribosome assembly cofactor RimP [Phaeocystidibacter luteus]|uniref:Ribosome maturation factor RimP n=1 Tax=Phaeocystidibacter luteus TaxID=911197 RepID=A0A6N6RJL4_9FLAO|nr:ribosome assembly cofactor RimP [Phaeocystidibacter luteus]KAB2813933.1 ribosome assembly cofactor RimP [Phaeocystidibacter luteus]